MDTEVKDKEESGSKPNITAYLQAPRRKRKNFVVLALGEKNEKFFAGQIQGFVRKVYPNLAVSHPKNIKDLFKQFGRNISLLIMDDQFDTMENVINAMSVLKVKSRRDIVPVLYLTSNPEQLIRSYNEKLSVYQEADDYCDLTRMSLQQVLGRVRVGVESKNGRKSRRYKVDWEIKLFHLRKGKDLEGQILDLSVHGALVRAPEVEMFKLGDQVKLAIPAGRFLEVADGEFLHLAARVRRVFVGGHTAGVSFEHISDHQHEKLTRFLANYAREQMVA